MKIDYSKRAENINRVLFRISNAINTSKDLNQLYAEIHHALGRIIDDTNFYIAIYTSKKRMLRFPYFKDEKEGNVHRDLSDFNISKSLTGQVIIDKKPVLLDTAQLVQRSADDRVRGPVPLTWLGVPLINDNKVIGVMAVQSYTDPHIFDAHDVEFLASVSEQIALAIDRKRAQQALVESERRFREIADLLPTILCELDQDLYVTYMNRIGNEVFDITPAQFESGWQAARLFHPDDTDRVSRFLDDIRKGKRIEGAEYRLGNVTQKKIVALVYSSPVIRDGEVAGARLNITDITIRKKREKERGKLIEALRQTKDKLTQYSAKLERKVRARTLEISNFLEYSPSVISIKDTQGCYRLVNARFELLLGLQSEQIQGKTDFDLHPEKAAKQYSQNDQVVLQNRAPYQVKEYFPQPEGSQKIYLSTKFPIFNSRGIIEGVGSIATDITALEKTQERLKKLSASIINKQEQERAYIARELHDELGQDMTVLQMEVQWLSKQLKANTPSLLGRIERLHDTIDKTLCKVRDLARGLRPWALDHLGLVDALSWYTTDFARRTRIPCTFQYEKAHLISPTKTTAAYRIVQEALTNVVRHSKATRVAVSLDGNITTVILTISDNGCGFNLDKLDSLEGLGVAGMQERAILAGGKLEINSHSGVGTQVLFCFSAEDQKEVKG